MKDEIKKLRRLIAKLIVDTDSGNSSLEKAKYISDLTKQYCKLVELQKREVK